MNYKIATLSDIPTLCALRKRQLMDEGLEANVNIDRELEDFFHRHLTNGRLVQWVAEEEGEIVATAGILFYDFPPAFDNKTGQVGYVSSVYTVPAYRRRGLCTALLDKVTEEARGRGGAAFTTESLL